MFSARVRQPGGGGKPAIRTQPGLLAALNALAEPSIRGDPGAAQRWVGKSHLPAALAERGFTAGQKSVLARSISSVRPSSVQVTCAASRPTGSERHRAPAKPIRNSARSRAPANRAPANVVRDVLLPRNPRFNRDR